ncbi:4-hydroxythreonine-4-phosphate dehydrogenase PdxA [Oscillatoria sp. CS-180]|uniref:4-hydroxythreonine-4-phosphate dehydrogenase PdxA n=1 Tax=Oscillatoria sp. CS-180 TaxID=3021720 RepID=UPI00232D08A1|nr:4-hydroxythreonine-4-phosphate dehydrogenase PdxA [Oscillatoria sp. CS-180]MDB9526187.1 4-hydroxythreonine-4-phosphate dehydrogenase PdxA [Oscillatoria sp. CS-180]
MKESEIIDIDQSKFFLKTGKTPPKLAIPLGDPAGIGPEVALKALGHPAFQSTAVITLVADKAWLRAIANSFEANGQCTTRFDQIAVVEPDQLISGLADVEPGIPSKISGEASFQWLKRAIAGAMSGEFDAVVTAPIAKSVWHAAGHLYPGQTEVLAEQAGATRFGMMFAAQSPHTQWSLRSLLATTHIPLKAVPTTLSADLMTQKLDLLVDCLQQDFGLATPHIAVAGLNPHSGEAGKLGTEEQDWLIPWLETARQSYPHVSLTGPVPPDTLWVSAGQAWYSTAEASPYDAYLALYHDQALIPIKLLAFDRAVNTTIGLPFVRTSPDHGTAFDIAGQGIARSESMEAAIALAIELVNHRKKLSLQRN